RYRNVTGVQTCALPILQLLMEKNHDLLAISTRIRRCVCVVIRGLGRARQPCVCESMVARFHPVCRSQLAAKRTHSMVLARNYFRSEERRVGSGASVMVS